MRPYPSPCDRCNIPDCRNYHKCSAYLKYVRTIWKQFNGYSARTYLAQKKKENPKFIYEHPDIIRRYLEQGPCANCQREENCDNPCAAYWNWWDARMEWHRKRLGAK